MESDALSMIGLDKKFMDSELQMVESLAKGKAIEHHLEPSYFVAMTKALDFTQAQDSIEGETGTRDPVEQAPEVSG